MSIYLSKQKQIPISRSKIITDDKEEFYSYLKEVFVRINTMFGDIIDNIQWNPAVIKQTSMPTPDKKQLLVWYDSDAAGGDPTHYLVFKTPDGTVVSFASEETA